MFQINLRISHKIDMLYRVINQVADSPVWHNKYGEDWVEKVTEIKKAIHSLYEKKDTHNLNL